MSDYDSNPFVGFFKARMQGASSQEALAVMAELGKPSGLRVQNMTTDDQVGDVDAEPNADKVRQSAIQRYVRDELREAALDALLEIAKPHHNPADIGPSIARAVVSHFEELLEGRDILGGEWSEIMLYDPETYDILYSSNDAGKATHDALADALGKTIAEYSDA